MVKEFLNHVEERNKYLKFFLKEGTTSEASLNDKELTDILEAEIPNKWANKLFQIGWDPQEKNLKDFKEFCEHLESLEYRDNKSTNVKKNSRSEEEMVKSLLRKSINLATVLSFTVSSMARTLCI